MLSTSSYSKAFRDGLMQYNIRTIWVHLNITYHPVLEQANTATQPNVTSQSPATSHVLVSNDAFAVLSPAATVKKRSSDYEFRFHDKPRDAISMSVYPKSSALRERKHEKIMLRQAKGGKFLNPDAKWKQHGMAWPRILG